MGYIERNHAYCGKMENSRYRIRITIDLNQSLIAWIKIR